jgi:anti-sigma factor RsiW
MTRETQLKLQAWLDGELPAADAREVRRLVERDPDAAALARELKLTRQWLAAGETLHPVPESREFYWAQIARHLTPRESATPAVWQPAFDWRRWLAWLAPAAAALVLLGVWLLPRLAPPQSAVTRAPEIETPSDDLGTFTFRSDTEQMTVVWVNAR